MPRPQRSTLFPYTTLFRSGKMVDVRGDHVALDKIKSPKPEGGDLVQDRAFVRNRVGQDDVEGRETIGGDEEKRVAEIEDFADFAGAEFGNPRQIEITQRRHEQSGKQERRKNQKNSCFPVFLIHYSLWAAS